MRYFNLTFGFIILFALLVCVFPQSTYARSISYKNVFPATSSTVAVFLLPHQDDEMFMAGAIVAAQKAGKQVYVILVTDGATSSARAVINGMDDNGQARYSSIDRKRHFPAREGYQSLTPLLFSQARNREFFASIQTLGVPAQNIFFANPDALNGCANPIYRDRFLTSIDATKIIAYYYQKLGDGDYATVAGETARNGYNHSDHRALRNALVRFKGITNKYFFSERTYVGTSVRLSTQEQRAKYRALGDYYVWKPSAGLFAIGKYSVGPMMDAWRVLGSEFFYTADHFASTTPPIRPL